MSLRAVVVAATRTQRGRAVLSPFRVQADQTAARFHRVANWLLRMSPAETPRSALVLFQRLLDAYQRTTRVTGARHVKAIRALAETLAEMEEVEADLVRQTSADE